MLYIYFLRKKMLILWKTNIYNTCVVFNYQVYTNILIYFNLQVKSKIMRTQINPVSNTNLYT